MKLNFLSFFGQKKNTKWLVIIFIVGVALLLLPTSGAKPDAEQNAANSCFNRSAYEKELETRLAKILATVQGVSDVSVMVTLEDSGESYFARNESTDEKVSGESNLAEQSRRSEGSLALPNSSGGGQAPVLLKTEMPRVSGVLVTAHGVGSDAVRSRIISAVRAVIGVPIHRVEVLEKA